MMERLPMCRICLAENVRMYIVVNRKLHELYEKLTDIPFVTEDYRPIIACVFCCAKLKQCYRLLRQCVEAEKLFTQMVNEDHELNPLINQARLEFCSGLITSPIFHISVDDECETGNTAIKEELPAVSDGLDDDIEPMEEDQSDGENKVRAFNGWIIPVLMYSLHKWTQTEVDALDRGVRTLLNTNRLHHQLLSVMRLYKCTPRENVKTEAF